MSTSLAEQLQRLQAPQTVQPVDTRKVSSILFDTNTAEELTIDKAFQLGVQGIKELQILNPRFKIFEDLLFREASKSIQRAVETPDFNEKLDLEVKKFLFMVSPHLALKPALQALEWLVHRFQIGEYTANELMMCALPYHNTPTFCLIIRAIPEIKRENSTWNWLEPVLKSGTPLDVHTVHRMAAKQLHFLRLILQYTIDAHKDSASGDSSRLQVQFSFAATTLLGVMVLLKQDFGQQHLAAMVPFLHVGLSSTSTTLLASCLAVIAHLVANYPISETFTIELLTHLTLVKIEALKYEALSVLVLLMTSQTRIAGSPPKFNTFVTTQLANMPKFAESFQKIHDNNQTLNLIPFLLPLLESALGDCRNEGIFFVQGVDKTVIRLLEKLSLDEEQASAVIRHILEHLPADTSNIPEINWFANVCQILESRYPSAFDLMSKETFSEDSELKESFHVILSHKGLEAEDGALTVQGICHQLVHPEEAIRASAVRTAAKLIKNAKENEKVMLQSCLRDRLKDDSMAVVCAVLTLKNFCKIVAQKDELFDLLLDLLEYAKLNKWNLKAIAYLVAHIGNVAPDELSEAKKITTILAVLPHVVHHPEILTIFVDTKFGLNSTMIRDIKKNVDAKDVAKKHQVAAILDVVKEVWKNSSLDFLDVVKDRLKNPKLNALDFYLLSLLLQGIAPNAHTALHKADCFQQALEIRNRAKVVFPKNPLFPPLNKAELLTLQLNNLVKNNLFPIHAFTDIITALVREPMLPIFSEMADSVQQSMAALLSSDGEESQIYEGPHIFKWPERSSGSEKEEYLKLSISIMSTLLELCSKFAQTDEEQSHMLALRTFVMANFSTFECQLHFLSIMWSQPDLQMEDRMRAVIFATSIIKLHHSVKTNITQLHPENCFVPALLCALSSSESYLRQVAVKLLLELMNLRPADPLRSYHPLMEHLAQQSDEMIQHNDQLGIALFSVLTDDEAVQNFSGNLNKKNAKSIRKCLFAHVKLPQTPRDLSASMLRALSYVKSQECLRAVIPFAKQLLDESYADDTLDDDNFEILRSVLQRIDENTAEKLLNVKEGWALLEKYFSSKLVHDDQTVASIAVANVTKEMFESLAPSQKTKLIHMLLQVDNETFNLKAAVATVLRKLPLAGDLVANELKLMIGKAKSVPVRITRQKVVSTEAAAAKVTSGNEWAQGTVLLEALPDKKVMKDAHLVVPILFNILKICLESEDDQEYVKQLTLSSLNTLLALSEAKGVNCAVDIELIVNSLKSTTNPRTQRETLILLCYTAHLVPDNLMHHLVSVFTFVGSLVLRHDDEYSLQIITQVISKVVPAVLQSKGQSTGLESILRVFTDALPDIPSHRRMLVFDQLMSTVGWEHLWLFLVLVFESQTYNKQNDSRRLDCALEATKTCQLPVLLKMLYNVFQYLSVFTEIEYDGEKQASNGMEIKMKMAKLNAANLIDPCTKPASDVRKFQIMALDFMSNMLSIKSSANKGLRATDKLDPKLEQLYQSLMDCLMSYLLILSHKEAAKKTHAKFWSCLLLQGYSVLNKLNMLLPLPQFVSVVQGVLTSTSALDSVKSKTLELLGAKLQLLNKASGTEMMELLPLIKVCQDLVNNVDSNISCKALFCLRLLISLIGSENLSSHLDLLKKLLTKLMTLATKVLAEENHPVMANLMLCLAELTVVLKVHMLSVLPTLIPLTLQAAKSARTPGEGQSDIMLLASLALLQRLIETLPQFLSSFLQPVLCEVCQISTIEEDDISTKAHSALQHRIQKIQGLLSGKISLRVLLQPIHDAFIDLSKNASTLPSIKPLMAILTAKFESMASTEFSSYSSELSTFFLEIMELRSNWESLYELEMNDGARDAVSNAEEEVISALVTFVLKLQEPVFKPFFFKLFNWAREAEQELANRSRCISFYRIATSLANKLKGLFTVFVPIYIKQAAQLLQSCQQSSDEPFFGPTGETQTLLLLEWLLKNLLEVFTQDRQRFVKQETFDLIMQSLVDQLENLIGGEEVYLERGQKLVGPCLAQFARCMQDDILWKQLHYQILLKTRSNHPKVRLVTIDAIQTFAETLREDLLPLLPEAIPFIAELMEDEDPEVEKRTQHVSRELEKILGEPLDKYF